MEDIGGNIFESSPTQEFIMLYYSIFNLQMLSKEIEGGKLVSAGIPVLQ